MTPIRTLVITQSLDVASLWDPPTGSPDIVGVLPARPMDEPTSLLWHARFPRIELLGSPEAALAWAPNCVVGIEPGYSNVTDQFRAAGAVVVNSSPFQDRLGLDPETSRNAIVSLYPPGSSRRYIALHANSLILKGEALYYALRYPEDHWILDLPDGAPDTLTITTPEILKEEEQFLAIVHDCPSLYCNRVGGLLSHNHPPPAVLFSLTLLHSSDWVGPPIASWHNGVDRLAGWFPYLDSPLVTQLKKLCQAWKVRGALTLQCCQDENGGVQVYRIDPGMPQWLWGWLRLSVAPTQPWSLFWFSIGKGVKFAPELSPTPFSYALEIPRDNDEAIRIREDQVAIGQHRGFERDTLVSPTQWQYRHFSVTTLGELAQVCQTGLTAKRPLWASAELLRVTELIKSWNVPPPEVPQEDEPVPPSLEEAGSDSIIEKEELVHVC